MRIQQLRNATLLVTHEHPDHLDRPGLDWIRSRRLPTWAAPVDAPNLRRKLAGVPVGELRTPA